MRIILLKDVGGVGQHGEVKDIADGYAQNFLIPRGFAEQATEEKITAREKRVVEETAAKKEREERLAKIIQSLEGARIEIKARVTEKGGLFRSIGAKEIATAIIDQRHVQVSEEVVELKQPIKTVGEHGATLTAHGAKAEITVAIAAT